MYALIENGVVKQIQPNEQEGFTEVPVDTVCGQIDNGDGTFSNPAPTPKTQEELDDEAKALGKDYNGYLVPLTSKDAVGMLQVKAAFELGALSTNIKFSNGTIVPMTPEEFPAFATWFVTERNKFYT